MSKKLALNMYDNDMAEWENGGKLYRLHIQRDDCANSPREEWDNITIMAC